MYSMTNATRCSFSLRTLPPVCWANVLAMAFDAMHSNSSMNTIPSLRSYRMSVIVFDLGIKWKLIHRKNVRASCCTLFRCWSVRSFSEVITLDLSRNAPNATDHSNIVWQTRATTTKFTTKQLNKFFFLCQLFRPDSNYDFQGWRFDLHCFFVHITSVYTGHVFSAKRCHSMQFRSIRRCSRSLYVLIHLFGCIIMRCVCVFVYVCLCRWNIRDKRPPEISIFIELYRWL